MRIKYEGNKAWDMLYCLLNFLLTHNDFQLYDCKFLLLGLTKFSTPPNTQLPDHNYPKWQFLCKNSDSLISTILLKPFSSSICKILFINLSQKISPVNNCVIHFFKYSNLVCNTLVYISQPAINNLAYFLFKRLLPEKSTYL